MCFYFIFQKIDIQSQDFNNMLSQKFSYRRNKPQNTEKERGIMDRFSAASFRQKILISSKY